MPCHLRRRPAKRSPATPVCPTGCAPEYEPRLSPVQTSTSDHIQFDLWAQQLSCYFGIDHLVQLTGPRYCTKWCEGIVRGKQA